MPHRKAFELMKAETQRHQDSIRRIQSECRHRVKRSCGACDGWTCVDCAFHFYSDPVG